MNKKGDESKKPEYCKNPQFIPNTSGVGGRYQTCPNIKEKTDYIDFEGEQYYCDVCGESYYLDYEDMK